MWPSSGMTPWMGCEKKITRDYKKNLSKEEKKEFRSLMWEMRRDPKDLTPQESAKLEGLFLKIPQLRTLYALRMRFKEIFDKEQSRKQASMALTELFFDAM